jgi:hypothetical protein
MKMKITFEENGIEILHREKTIGEDKYPDGKRMLQSDIVWDLDEILVEVENIINEEPPKF